jgi:hypothetical protein
MPIEWCCSCSCLGALLLCVLYQMRRREPPFIGERRGSLKMCLTPIWKKQTDPKLPSRYIEPRPYHHTDIGQGSKHRPTKFRSNRASGGVAAPRVRSHHDWARSGPSLVGHFLWSLWLREWWYSAKIQWFGLGLACSPLCMGPDFLGDWASLPRLV